MIRTIRKTTTPNSTDLTVYKTSSLGPDSFVVRDNDCQMERVYTIGKIANLGSGNPSEVTSVKQVVTAWERGEVYF